MFLCLQMFSKKVKHLTKMNNIESCTEDTLWDSMYSSASQLQTWKNKSNI